MLQHGTDFQEPSGGHATLLLLHTWHQPLHHPLWEDIWEACHHVMFHIHAPECFNTKWYFQKIYIVFRWESWSNSLDSRKHVQQNLTLKIKFKINSEMATELSCFSTDDQSKFSKPSTCVKHTETKPSSTELQKHGGCTDCILILTIYLWCNQSLFLYIESI